MGLFSSTDDGPRQAAYAELDLAQREVQSVGGSRRLQARLAIHAISALTYALLEVADAIRDKP